MERYPHSPTGRPFDRTSLDRRQIVHFFQLSSEQTHALDRELGQVITSIMPPTRMLTIALFGEDIRHLIRQQARILHPTLSETTNVFTRGDLGDLLGLAVNPYFDNTAVMDNILEALVSSRAGLTYRESDKKKSNLLLTQKGKTAKRFAHSLIRFSLKYGMPPQLFFGAYQFQGKGQDGADNTASRRIGFLRSLLSSGSSARLIDVVKNAGGGRSEDFDGFMKLLVAWGLAEYSTRPQDQDKNRARLSHPEVTYLDQQLVEELYGAALNQYPESSKSTPIRREFFSDVYRIVASEPERTWTITEIGDKLRADGSLAIEGYEVSTIRAHVGRVLRMLNERDLVVYSPEMVLLTTLGLMAIGELIELLDYPDSPGQIAAREDVADRIRAEVSRAYGLPDSPSSQEQPDILRPFFELVDFNLNINKQPSRFDNAIADIRAANGGILPSASELTALLAKRGIVASDDLLRFHTR